MKTDLPASLLAFWKVKIAAIIFFHDSAGSVELCPASKSSWGIAEMDMLTVSCDSFVVLAAGQEKDRTNLG